VHALAFELLRGVAEGGLHDAAGGSEDQAGAGAEAERHVEGLGLQLLEVDAGGVDHPAELGGGQDDVDVG
jgi:hypothetical protein